MVPDAKHSEGSTRPQNLPAREPINFEEAKGAVQQYASTAAATLEAYWAARMAESKSVPRLADVLGQLSSDSAEAENVDSWKGKLAGHPLKGSGKVGALVLARNIVDVILEHDKLLPEGNEEDKSGDLTKAGLRKLSKGLNFAVTGMTQWTVGERRFKPSYRFSNADRAGDASINITTNLRNILVAQPGNEELKRSDVNIYMSGRRTKGE